MWKVRVFTLYPELFPGPLNNGLYRKALDKKIWNIEVINIREYAKNVLLLGIWLGHFFLDNFQT